MLLAATATVVATAVPAIASVNVPAVPAVFVTIIFVNTVVVDDGVVYRTVAVFVVAAPRKSALVVVAISSYLLGMLVLQSAHHNEC
jgi:hypothetical protein